MRLDESAIQSLARLRDPIGVLSIYACATPDRQANERPPWTIAIEHELDRLEEQVKAEGPRERWVALSARLDAIRPELPALLDPQRPGRGFAIFAPVSDGAVSDLAIQFPFPDRVVLSDAPYVGPLVTAFDESRPSGVAVVDRHGVRVLEWVAGHAEDVAMFFFDESQAEDWRTKTGPPPAQPGYSRRSASNRESFEQRMDDNRNRYLRSVADRVDGVVASRGWDRLVLCTDERLHVFEEALQSQVEIIHSEIHFGDVPASQVADAVTPLIERSQRTREVEFVELAVDRAAAGGRGSAGLRDTIVALNFGQVDRLLIDPRRTFTGYRATDGLLSIEPEDGFEPEPDLGERMVELALFTKASVTPVEDEAAERLAPVDGVAAILRW
jgi:hypothetical protein